jgi:ribose 5-phosphate isomerase A
MDNDERKRAAAAAALDWAVPRLRPDLVVGIGTGSTADHFIDLLAPLRSRFAGAVASSSRSTARLERHDIPVYDLEATGELPFYVDGADEINAALEMTKGGGGALTREKILAASSALFVCIVDASKRVTTLGRFALPIEVIPMACSYVERQLGLVAKASGLAPPAMTRRSDADGRRFVTDNGNWIVDVSGWTIADPPALERRIGSIVGVVESGLFALRRADILFVADANGVETRTASAGNEIVTCAG